MDLINTWVAIQKQTTEQHIRDVHRKVILEQQVKILLQIGVKIPKARVKHSPFFTKTSIYSTKHVLNKKKSHTFLLLPYQDLLP